MVSRLPVARSNAMLPSSRRTRRFARASKRRCANRPHSRSTPTRTSSPPSCEISATTRPQAGRATSVCATRGHSSARSTTAARPRRGGRADGVGDDPDCAQGGGDETLYRIPLAELGGEPASVRAALYYQATPPYYLQDRFCTSKSEDTKRLYYIAGKLDVSAPRPRKRRCAERVTGRLRSPPFTRHLQGRSPRKKRNISREASGPCGSV